MTECDVTNRFIAWLNGSNSQLDPGNFVITIKMRFFRAINEFRLNGGQGGCKGIYVSPPRGVFFSCSINLTRSRFVVFVQKKDYRKSF